MSEINSRLKFCNYVSLVWGFVFEKIDSTVELNFQPSVYTFPKLDFLENKTQFEEKLFYTFDMFLHKDLFHPQLYHIY